MGEDGGVPHPSLGMNWGLKDAIYHSFQRALIPKQHGNWGNLVSEALIVSSHFPGWLRSGCHDSRFVLLSCFQRKLGCPRKRMRKAPS